MYFIFLTGYGKENKKKKQKQRMYSFQKRCIVLNYTFIYIPIQKYLIKGHHRQLFPY